MRRIGVGEICKWAERRKLSFCPRWRPDAGRAGRRVVLGARRRWVSGGVESGPVVGGSGAMQGGVEDRAGVGCRGASPQPAA